MQPKNKWKSIAVITLLTVNIAVTVFIVFYLFIPTQNQQENQSSLAFDYTANGQYVLYIGTNDKDTYEQIIPTESAKEIVNEICAKYVEGYTVSESQGGWVDENGILTQENTLVYTFTDASESEIIAIMREVLTALNQNSILVERRDISSVFFNGKE